ncbi:MAG: divergent polysaccharide deacetylase family protein [Deltaproteobacteria bacterium]|nr:divergent polysaccharide deacetylase family protein [Deltaproteobacteria bacterium]
MDRRSFLLKSASLLAGSLFGLNTFSRAFAFEQYENNKPSQLKIALIIDDIGYSFTRARQFLELDVPITFSILPRLPKSHRLAMEIHSAGHEIMLHQPMEPHSPRIDPGPGALRVEDRPETIVKTMEDNISEIPLAVGVNNHMGSRFTECCTGLNEALSVVKNKELFFIDSLTSSHSQAYKVARGLGMVTARRNVCVDYTAGESAALSQLEKLQIYAIRDGYAVGIGHPFPETARAIKHFLNHVKYDEVSMVHVSDVLYT